MATNWKNEVLKYYPNAECLPVHRRGVHLGGVQIVGCEKFGAKSISSNIAWKQTYFNIVKSAPVKSKFTKGEIVNHNDYLAHVNTFSMLRMNGNPAWIDKEYLTELERKIKAYEKLQPVNNANSSKGSYPTPGDMINWSSEGFFGVSNGANEVIKELTYPNLITSKLQKIKQQITWLWAFLTIIFLAFILVVIAVIKH